ncbi:MAG TPA: fibronectin type III domain-containing protein [Cellvibrio sp.]
MPKPICLGSFPEILVFVVSLLVVACGGGGAGTHNAGFSAPASQAVSSTFAASSQDLSSASSSAISTLESSSSSSVVKPGFVEIYWTAPDQRENGDFLDISEIGGYELRYKRREDDHYTRIIINDNYANFYSLSILQDEYEFQIAVFDVKGLYSIFAEVTRM